MPAGSIWINDHTHEILEVVNMASGKQVLKIVGKNRLRHLYSRFPRLRRAIKNPGVC